MQTALRAVFPPECLSCGVLVEQEFSLCADCWAETPFILGASCDKCGVSLPGAAEPNATLICDDCRAIARPWHKGRAVMSYAGNARRLILGLKHGDRADVARAAGPWLARVAGDLIGADTVLIPVPLFRARLWRRRYNQSALLVQAMARISATDTLLDGLVRTRPTPSLDGKTRHERFDILSGAIAVNPRHVDQIAGRPIIIVDDVMTTGATLAAASDAVLRAGADSVSVITLARVAKDA